MVLGIATMTSKNQFTAPSKLRDMLRLKAGDRLIFTQKGGNVVVKAIKGTPKDMLEYLRRDLKEGVDIMALHAEFESDDEFR